MMFAALTETPFTVSEGVAVELSIPVTLPVVVA
jgi:hypothetical protein